MARQDVSELLTRAGGGDQVAAQQVLPEVYDALHQLALRFMASEPAGHTLQATALINEAYIRLVGEGDHPSDWNGKGHFYGAAAMAMRRILVERARRYGRRKHGGGHERIALDEAQITTDPPDIDYLALDEALSELERNDPRAAQIVMLRFFAGLSEEKTAAAMGVSERTIRRDWSYARLWLLKRMTADESNEPTNRDGQ